MRDNGKIYKKAFNAEVMGVYSSYSKLQLAAEDLAYYRALSCFMRSGKEGEEQRRQLMYEYAKSKNIANTKKDDELNIVYPSLPSNNLFANRVLSNICQVYNEKPRRINEIGEISIDIVNEILEECKYDSVMNELHKNIKLTGKVAVRPRFRNRKLDLQVLRADQYVAVYDSYGKVVEFYKPYIKVIPNPDGSLKEEQRFEYWDKDIYKELDVSGNETEFDVPVIKYNDITEDYTELQQITTKQHKHNLGAIPYMELSFGFNDNDGTEPLNDLYELIKTQLELNFIDYLVQENYKYSANSIGIAYNMKLDIMPRMSPGMIYAFDDIRDNEMSNIPPSITYETPETFFSELQELKESIKKSALKDMGLPTSLINDDSSIASSGIALRLDRKELEEARKQDLSYLKQIDKELIKHILTICKNDRASKYKEDINFDINKLEMSIDYSELNYDETYMEKTEKYEYKRGKGLISVKDYTVALTQNDIIKTDNEAIEFIKENKEMFKQIEDNDGNAGGNDEQEFGVAETGNDEGANGQEAFSNGEATNGIGNEVENINEQSK